VRDKHAKDVLDAIELGALLGVRRVVAMSGLPGTDAAARLPAWTVMPWDSSYLDARDYQWDEVAIPFWRDVQTRAADADVKVCIEMHPHNVVYNPATMMRLATEIDATHVGAEMDPSHLFWQGIDPVTAIEALGGLIYNAAAKGHPDQPGGPGQRGARRPSRPGAVRRPRGDIARRSVHAEHLARGLVVGLRRCRARSCRGVLEPLPVGLGEDRPGHGGEHRTRGRRARPARRTRVRRGDPAGRIASGLTRRVPAGHRG
jgi:hypothetical protein